MTLSAAERRLLGQMPLHAITSVHGEVGLPERLAIKIVGFPAGEREPTGEALALASGFHAGERRQRVTNPVYEPGRDEDDQYREHVAGSLAASPWARVIKASDLTGNGLGIIHTTGPKMQRLAARYGPLVPVLRGLILRADTPLEPDVKGRTAGQLDAAQGRFAAIWHPGASGGDLQAGAGR